MHFTYSSMTSTKIEARDYIDGLSSHTFLLQTSKDKRIPLPEEKAYVDPLPINRKKWIISRYSSNICQMKDVCKVFGKKFTHGQRKKLMKIKT